MKLGEKLKQARLTAGMSQRQLCGEEITRNMLSQIENGLASPSMATLRYLAGRLEKPVSYFLEEDAVTSPNQQVMERARSVWEKRDPEGLKAVLELYRKPDPVFDPEYQLLTRLCALEMAESAVAKGRNRHGERLLEELGPICSGYCAPELERRRLLLLGQVQTGHCRELCAGLPDLDGELLLRARAALESGDTVRSGCLLDGAERQESSGWNLLRGEVYFARREYEKAVECYLKAEPESAARLELCYRELGNYERAYHYACIRRQGG